MDKIESNIFEIQNLQELNCKYRLYKVKGIPKSSEDYDKNIQLLLTKLIYMTKSPCEKITLKDELFIAQPIAYEKLPEKFNLVGMSVSIETIEELKELKFDNLSSEDQNIAVRFLQFSLQHPLFENPNLWQPKAGEPFFYKNPDSDFRRYSTVADLYRGFKFRVIPLNEKKLGIAIDRSSKYVAKNPLPSNITSDNFRKYKNKRVVYEYGNDWYEIVLSEISDLKCFEQIVEGESLFDCVHKKASSGLKSPLLMKLPKDCSVLVYKTATGAPRFVPSAMCRQTLTTDHPEISKYHSYTIDKPNIRRQQIQYIIEHHFRNINFNGQKIILSEKPMSFECLTISTPELEFGKNKILRIKNSTELDDFPINKKKYLLFEGGFFIKKHFDRQYFILPRSVFESYGKKFYDDLKNEVNAIYSSDGGKYDPSIIVYNDSVQRSAITMGREIIETVKHEGIEYGYAVVMIPRLPSHWPGKEDQLANLLIRKLREINLYASIIHTTIAENSICQMESSTGSIKWELINDHRQKGKYKGYLMNVAINKILLLNNIYPFVLHTPLFSDLVLGIDVKKHVAGFTLISKKADKIYFDISKSDQSEQLRKNQIKTKVIEILKHYIDVTSGICDFSIKNILVHRDGILYESEKQGVLEALSDLKLHGKIGKNCTASFMEIKKSSRAPVRLFDVIQSMSNQREFIENPLIGVLLKFKTEAFLITTGRPYKHPGTAKPLHLVWCGGEMGFDNAIEDTFKLANLTWTKIDDCLRVPLSIKITDIHLREVAGEYDTDSFEYGDEDE